MKYFIANKNYHKLLLIGILYCLSFVLLKQIVNINTSLNFGKYYVIYSYSYCIFLNAIGYLSFYFLNKKHQNYTRGNIISGLLFLPSLLMNILISNNIISIFLFGISSLCYGYIGGYFCYFLSIKLVSNKNKGKIFGFSIGFATLFQIIITLLTKEVYILIIIVYFCIVVLFLLCHNMKNIQFSTEKNTSDKITKKQSVLAILIVFFSSFIVGSQDGLAVFFGAFNHSQPYGIVRIFYVFGSVISGIVADYKKGKYYALITLCSTFIAVIGLFFLKLDGMINYYLLLLYFFMGFFVVYTLVRFIIIAQFSNKPKLWASLGRVVSCIAIGISVIPANLLFEIYGLDSIITINLVIIIPLIILFYLNMGCVFNNRQAELLEEKGTKNIEDFLNNYPFTPKERIIIQILIEKNLQIKEIAFELKISIRSVQRHLTSIYNKTNTSSKSELINLFYKR